MERNDRERGHKRRGGRHEMQKGEIDGWREVEGQEVDTRERWRKSEKDETHVLHGTRWRIT